MIPRVMMLCLSLCVLVAFGFIFAAGIIGPRGCFFISLGALGKTTLKRLSGPFIWATSSRG
jgi:hypothetical protein